jgi:hypothetical protein
MLLLLTLGQIYLLGFGEGFRANSFFLAISQFILNSRYHILLGRFEALCWLRLLNRGALLRGNLLLHFYIFWLQHFIACRGFNFRGFLL